MLRYLIIVLIAISVESVTQNSSCPVISPRELDLKELDGTWYISAAATDLKLSGDCAMVTFSHKTNNTTDISIAWINNGTASYYNGSVGLTVDPNNNVTGDLLMVTYKDKKTEKYSFLDVDYSHYAVIFACYDDAGGSTYEIWKMTRSPHVKDDAAAKLDKALADYNLQGTKFMNFNNTEDTCRVNGGSSFTPSLVITSAAAITIFRRLY